MASKGVPHGLADYWRDTKRLTDFERTRIMSLRAVVISEQGPSRGLVSSRPYVEDAAEAEMKAGLLRGLVACRDAHMAKKEDPRGSSTNRKRPRDEDSHV